MIGAYLTDTIELHRASKRDKWGEPEADAVITLPAKVNESSVLVKDIKGENVWASMSVILKSRAVSHEDYIKFPADATGREYAILRIDKPKDFSWGYLEVFLK